MGDKMIFDIENSEFTLLDVLRISRTNDQTPGKSRGRPIASVACRLSGFSEIVTNGGVLRPDPENYLITPPGAFYTHRYMQEEVIALHLSFTKNPPKEICLVHCSLPDVKDRFISLYEFWSSKCPGYMSKCKSLIYEIFYLFECQAASLSCDRIKPSMDYLYSCYCKKDFSVGEMINKSFLSQAYFRRIFREIYGCSVVDFINGLRIERAKTLLLGRNMTVKEVSGECGFEDEKYFSRVFRAITGIAPSRYNSPE